ncbi:MAG: ribonuclease M5 [Anaerovoracaceae bacterium]|nr:ribonuclease M5 [Anaerovoracaceae bacterium]
MIKEAIVVEGRDDTAAVLCAVDGDTIETHGLGLNDEIIAALDRAYESRGLIIFTDPDHAGGVIRQRLAERYPDAKHAYLDREDAERRGDIGIENADPDAIREALAKARPESIDAENIFSMDDLFREGLAGGAGASEKRRMLCRALGIGYANAAGLLKKLNRCGITKEEFERHLHR